VQIRIFVDLSPVIDPFRLVGPKFQSAYVGPYIGNYSLHERIINRTTVSASEHSSMYQSLAHMSLQFIFEDLVLYLGYSLYFAPLSLTNLVLYLSYYAYVAPDYI
jgi:hypothetical protein